MSIRSHMLLAAGAVAGMLAFAPAHAQETVKIGLILPMTGGQASTGKQIDNAVKLYMQQNGDTVAGKKIEVILKDDAAVPDNTKRLAQELIVNDKVNFIAGFGVTPAALAAAPLATQAKVPEIVMAAGTSIITERSPYIVRTSFTLAQSSTIIGDWAAKNGGATGDNVAKGFYQKKDWVPAGMEGVCSPSTWTRSTSTRSPTCSTSPACFKSTPWPASPSSATRSSCRA